MKVWNRSDDLLDDEVTNVIMKSYNKECMLKAYAVQIQLPHDRQSIIYCDFGFSCDFGPRYTETSSPYGGIQCSRVQKQQNRFVSRSRSYRPGPKLVQLLTLFRTD